MLIWIYLYQTDSLLLSVYLLSPKYIKSNLPTPISSCFPPNPWFYSYPIWLAGASILGRWEADFSKTLQLHLWELWHTRVGGSSVIFSPGGGGGIIQKTSRTRLVIPFLLFFIDPWSFVAEFRLLLFYSFESFSL